MAILVAALERVMEIDEGGLSSDEVAWKRAGKLCRPTVRETSEGVRSCAQLSEQGKVGVEGVGTIGASKMSVRASVDRLLAASERVGLRLLGREWRLTEG